MNRFIALFAVAYCLLLTSSCKKTGSASPAPPGAGGKCRLVSQQKSDGTVLVRLTYDNQGALILGEGLDPSGTVGIKATYSPGKIAGTRRKDYYHIVNGKTYHESYEDMYIGASGNIDSLWSFSCQDCGVENPTQFTSNGYQRFTYNDHGDLITNVAYDGARSMVGITRLTLDDQYRLVATKFEDAYGSVDSIHYEYNDPVTFRLATENQLWYTGIFGKFQPSDEDIYKDGTFQRHSRFTNTGTAEGYLASILIDGTSPEASRFGYDCN